MLKYIQFFLLIICSLLVPISAIERGPSTPYVSGDTFKDFCDFSYDELDRNIDPWRVKEGSTIFIKTDYLYDFFTKVHPYITAHYIVVTGNSDYYVPGVCINYLNAETLIAWFGTNIEKINHPKLHPIPLGVANSYWGHGNVDTIREIQQMSLQLEKTILLYANFTEHTCPSERKEVSRLFNDHPYCVRSNPTKPFKNYLIDLAQSKFVLSPRGNGLDCHRTWEALLMGAIPIVKQSQLDPMYENLPVCIVKDWAEITEEFLMEKYEEMKDREYQIEKNYIFYWLDLINSYKTSIIN